MFVITRSVVFLFNFSDDKKKKNKLSSWYWPQGSVDFPATSVSSQGMKQYVQDEAALGRPCLKPSGQRTNPGWIVLIRGFSESWDKWVYFFLNLFLEKNVLQSIVLMRVFYT